MATAERGAISLDEFKARLPLVDIVARHVRLTRRGREHVGLCPFHNEKTPSFTLSETKGFYHCFGCGQHGTAIDFVMAVEGLEFPEALRRLSELTGIPLPQQSGGEARIDRSLVAVNEAAARWFAGRLESAQGEGARGYLKGRGLDGDAIARFGLGYAPPGPDALKAALLAEGFTEAQLIEAGLLAVREEDGSAYDRFRHRLMFPIQDARGRTVGFGGRALAEARAKYLNTSETALFRKGELLYGLPLARAAAREHGTVIVAEGYMDVIALWRAGFANAVAPLGTAITEAQLALLWRLADEPLVCLDGDEAGRRAAHRLVERALLVLQPGKSLRFVLLPPGQDPDSLLRTAGPGPLRRCLEAPVALVDFLWERELAGRTFATPERRAALKQRLRALAGAIANRDLRWLFVQEMRRRYDARFGPRREPGRGAPPPLWSVGQGVGAARLSAGLARAKQASELDLLGPVLCRPELLPEIEDELNMVEFSSAELGGLRDHILSWYNEQGDLDPERLRAHLSEIGFAGLVGQLAASGHGTAGYRRPGVALERLLEDWRATVARHGGFSGKRAEREAAAAAILRSRDEREVKAHVLAVDRLINQKGHVGPRISGDEA